MAPQQNSCGAILVFAWPSGGRKKNEARHPLAANTSLPILSTIA
jgi:hypothetical protein